MIPRGPGTVPTMILTTALGAAAADAATRLEALGYTQ